MAISRIVAAPVRTLTFGNMIIGWELLGQRR